MGFASKLYNSLQARSSYVHLLMCPKFGLDVKVVQRFFEKLRTLQRNIQENTYMCEGFLANKPIFHALIETKGFAVSFFLCLLTANSI